ncbi:hypothetical protein N836_33475 [Leptolyngbya sp. Heron Island J]|uniref:PIN domain-containing protein n=1 Tax=Leptolyngbya sp. Heron Island J TaxID=1385935 RepID=UPI0003B9AB64|nr:PIN domain-containing protein [Leptolyngbya sp. Heron Island J]ESA38342.1 hypothetical protein N836_33475 [Leptolyngbya sp. Heron Island J]
MSANDSLVFIDTNKYLDLYRINRDKKLLELLLEQVDHIFVTQQIFDEFKRNKLSVAAESFKEKSKALRLTNFNLPDHLSSQSIDQDHTLQQLQSLGQDRKKLLNQFDSLLLKIIEQISRSEDDISKALSHIFANAVAPSSEELQRARNRRELGNPPGKKTDPLGDQLTWEEILTHFKGKKRLWIISRDSDYDAAYGNQSFLNCFLYDELCRVTPEHEVYIFEDLSKGLQHFVKTTGVRAEKQLTPEETQEIEKEERSLPSLYRQSEVMGRVLANIDLDALNRAVEKQGEMARRMLANIDFDALNRLAERQRKENLRMIARLGLDVPDLATEEGEKE